jgi:hypothetical protein
VRLTECGVSGCAHGFTETKRGVKNCTRVEICLTVLFDSRRWHMASGTCQTCQTYRFLKLPAFSLLCLSPGVPAAFSTWCFPRPREEQTCLCVHGTLEGKTWSKLWHRRRHMASGRRAVQIALDSRNSLSYLRARAVLRHDQHGTVYQGE